jgi:hypothetical protein
MNSREKFHSVMDFAENAEIPKVEFAYWAGTLRNWFAEGLPQTYDVPDSLQDAEPVKGSFSSDDPEHTDTGGKNVADYFSLGSHLEKFPFDVSPLFKEETIEENNDFRIYRDNFGVVKKLYRKQASTPFAIDFPVKNRRDLKEYISRYDYDFGKRLPANFGKLSLAWKDREFPVRLGGNPFGFSFLARRLMGEVNFMISLYDDPGLIKELNEFYLDFIMRYWSGILEKIDVDCALILEDIAYRNGSFISREMFVEFMQPYYIKLVDFLNQYGIGKIAVDCDGLISELIPLWVRTGVNILFPLEAVNDIREIRKAFPRLGLIGGFDKKVLFSGSTREKIDRELEKTMEVMKLGGYIPHVDHAVSQDVTWENFKYYRTRLNEMIDDLS